MGLMFEKLFLIIGSWLFLFLFVWFMDSLEGFGIFSLIYFIGSAGYLYGLSSSDKL